LCFDHTTMYRRKRWSHCWKPRRNRTPKTTTRAITRRRRDCPRAQTRATRHTRLLHPDELTRPEYQTTRPTCQTRIRMTSSWHNHDASIHSQHPVSRRVIIQSACHVIVQSACHVIVQSSATSSKWGPTCHVTRLELSHAELSEPSRIGAEPSREPRYRIQCSWSYVQPNLWLNMSRWLGQNCFDQILAVWSAIWTISDLFPANLIVPDAMVRSDHWDLSPKMAVVN
jgi:hypothetical protein